MEPQRIGFQVDTLLAPEQALTVYFAHAQLGEPETELVPLERACGRILAQRMFCDAAYPAAPRSAMDGFAVRSRETPGRLRIAGEIRMGHVWEAGADADSAVRIPTGGVVPAGFDAVVPIEDAAVEGDGVTIAAAIPAGDCITPAGTDMRAGEKVLEARRRIGGAEMGVLATLGAANVPVYRKPAVAVFSSGDELVDPACTPTAAQVRDSNRWAIAGTLEALGVTVLHLPTAPDEPHALEALLRDGLKIADAVVLTGGSSVGERDLTPRIVERLGHPGVIVHGLKVRPGKPTVLACVDGKPIIGLPGNPASALTILQAVAAPIIRALTGAAFEPSTLECRLAEPLRKRTGWTWFWPVRVDQAAAPPAAYPLELRSGSVSLLARAGGFLILDETIEALPAGAPVLVTRYIGS